MIIFCVQTISIRKAAIIAKATAIVISSVLVLRCIWAIRSRCVRILTIDIRHISPIVVRSIVIAY